MVVDVRVAVEVDSNLLDETFTPLTIEASNLF
jgi:hypothetical protein